MLTNDEIIKLALDAGLLNYIDNETPRRYFISGHAEIEEVLEFTKLIIEKINLDNRYNIQYQNNEYEDWLRDECQFHHWQIKYICLNLKLNLVYNMQQIDQLSEIFTSNAVNFTEDNFPKAFFLILKTDDPFGFEIISVKTPIFKSKLIDDVYQKIETILNELTSGKVCFTANLAQEYAALSIAKNTKRGQGNIRYKDYVIYHGSALHDQIFYLAKDQHNEYWLFLHPNAIDYIETIAINNWQQTDNTII